MKHKPLSPADDAAQARSAYRATHEKDVIARLHRVEGQMRGLILMIEAGRPCEDVAMQMKAARKALDKTFYRMMVCSMIEAAQAPAMGAQGMANLERSARLLEKLA
jgi:CsoR family transcriptional regulator, copper-sensing transcriptional repressor